ncbi:MAG: hypothetical protein IPL45_04045 [Actinomycetales bacterium]|nr:hypothetical protein [Actinomycetales bacterium]
MSTDFSSRILGRGGDRHRGGSGAAYREFVDGAWTVVLVGDASQIRQLNVRALGRGAVTVVDN